MANALLQAGVPALEWSPLEDDGRNAPAVLFSKKVRNRLFATWWKWKQNIYLLIASHPVISAWLGWWRRGRGYKLWSGVWARLGRHQHGEEGTRTRPSQRLRCRLVLWWFRPSLVFRIPNDPRVLSQVTGRSRCLSQSSTLFGGPGSPWVGTSSCWQVEVATLCLLCTSTEEEPENCWRRLIVTLSWTRKCRRSQQIPNHGECQHIWIQENSELFDSLSVHHMVSVLVIRSPFDGRLFLAYPQNSGAQSCDRLQFLDDGANDLVTVIRFYFRGAFMLHFKCVFCK